MSLFDPLHPEIEVGQLLTSIQSCTLPPSPCTKTITGAFAPFGGIAPKNRFGYRESVVNGGACAGVAASGDTPSASATTKTMAGTHGRKIRQSKVSDMKSSFWGWCGCD